jgi:hypothetical protein
MKLGDEYMNGGYHEPANIQREKKCRRVGHASACGMLLLDTFVGEKSFSGRQN